MRDYVALRNNLKSADSTPTKPPADWGLYHDWEYLAFRFQIWVESGFQVWPRAGGMDEQDADLVADFRTLLLVYRYQEQDVLSKAK